MAEVSAIEWTDATVNFWWGCKKVGPGCDNCYAETWAQRFGIPDYDASGVRRKVQGAIKLIRKLQRGADKFEATHGRRRRVFIQSMSDFFDNAVDPAWRAEAWAEIVKADRLEIQLVTKRVSNVDRMVFAAEGGGAPWPSHVGLIATVVNQDEANRDVPRLLALKHKLRIPWVGLSIEPMLGPIDLASMDVPTPWKTDDVWRFDALIGRFGIWMQWGAGDVGYDGGDASNGPDVNGRPTYRDRPWERLGIDWVICGGESGSKARPMEVAWALTLRDQCEAAKVPFLFKQWGAWHADAMAYTDGQGRNPPPHMKIGVKAAGRTLMGRTHDGFPVTT